MQDTYVNNITADFLYQEVVEGRLTITALEKRIYKAKKQGNMPEWLTLKYVANRVAFERKNKEQK